MKGVFGCSSKVPKKIEVRLRAKRTVEYFESFKSLCSLETPIFGGEGF